MMGLNGGRTGRLLACFGAGCIDVYYLGKCSLSCFGTPICCLSTEVTLIVFMVIEAIQQREYLANIL